MRTVLRGGDEQGISTRAELVRRVTEKISLTRLK